MFRRCAGEHLLLKDALNSMAACMSDSANNVPMRHQTVTIRSLKIESDNTACIPS